MSRVLITYFGAFEGVDLNPTQTVAEKVRTNLGDSDHEIILHELPVTFAGSSRALEDALTQYTPDVVVATGVAVGRDKVSLERVAINLDDARIADNDGMKLVDRPIRNNGPAAFFSRLPIRAVFEQCREANLPVEISNTAGTYVCNHVFYELMYLLADRQVPAGFVHIPAITELVEQGIGSRLRASADAGGVEQDDVATVTLHDAVEVLTRVILASF